MAPTEKYWIKGGGTFHGMELLGGGADNWEYPREQLRITMNMKNKNIIMLLSAAIWLFHAKSSMCSIFFNPYSNLGGLSLVPGLSRTVFSYLLH